jgi:hypothetical protein
MLPNGEIEDVRGEVTVAAPDGGRTWWSLEDKGSKEEAVLTFLLKQKVLGESLSSCTAPGGGGTGRGTCWWVEAGLGAWWRRDLVRRR